MPYFYLPYAGTDDLYSLAVVLILAGLILSIWAQFKVKGNYKKFAAVPAPYTGAEAARRLLESKGIYNVSIVPIGGTLSDHFDPRTNTISLSNDVFSGRNIAAVGIACHEAGHAVQYAQSYGPLKWRNAVIPLCNIGSSLAIPLVLVGYLFNFYALSLLGVAFFGITLLFQLITLPVEFNASARAMAAIKENFLLRDDDALRGTRKVLSAAAMTYVAAMLVSLGQFLRLLSMVNRRRR